MRSKITSETDKVWAQLIIAAVALEFGIAPTEIFNRTKGSSQASLARQISMYLLNTVYGVNLSGVGRVFDRDRTTASHACGVVEELRDDPVLDQKISTLEVFLSGSPAPVSQRVGVSVDA